MNSWSRNNYETNRKEDRCEHCRKEERCEEKRDEEKRCESFVKCGCPNSATVTTGTTTSMQTVIATLNLDTSCICDPKIKLDFITNYVADGPVNIRLQVFRQCNNQATPVAIGPAWNFVVGSDITATFPFFICDQDICVNRDCCTYTVVAIPNVTFAEGSSITFNNSTLAATVTCGENECHRRCKCHN